MPQINLLPKGLAKKGAPKTLLKIKTEKVGVHILMSPAVSRFIRISLALVVVLGIFMFVLLKIKEMELNSLRQAMTAMNATPEELKRTQQEKETLVKQAELLEQFMSRQWLWFDKLGQMGALVPDGVWLTSTSLEKRKVAAPGEEKKEIEKSVIVIKGSTVAPTTSATVNLVGVFIETLKNDQRFSRDFSEIKLNNFYKDAIGPTEIINFELVCWIK